MLSKESASSPGTITGLSRDFFHGPSGESATATPIAVLVFASKGRGTPV